MMFQFYKGKEAVFSIKFGLLCFKYLGEKCVGHIKTGISADSLFKFSLYHLQRFSLVILILHPFRTVLIRKG